MNQDGGGDYVAIDIEAVTYFGARHALDSLSQFWTFDKGVMDSDTGKFIVLKDVILIDKPEFQHRGILLDTSRNFFPKVCNFIFIFSVHLLDLFTNVI